MTNENLLATVTALNSIRPCSWDPKPYLNRRETWGLFACFWHAYQYHTISVHNCRTLIVPSELARLISGIETIDECNWGAYGNGKCVPGFYATAKSARLLEGSTDHWYMIGRSSEKSLARLLRQKRLLSEEEQDLITYLDRPTGDPRLFIRPSPRLSC